MKHYTQDIEQRQTKQRTQGATKTGQSIDA